jgi:colanic acid biosynthesis glycosyl transferase WcaI
MKIILYGINFSPELTGIGKYTGELASWLVKQGHEVRVVTAPPYYPAWALGDGIRNRYASQGWLGVDVLRCPLWVPPQPGGLKRLAHLASFALSSLPVMLIQILWRPQLVWVVEPALFCAPTAVVVARLTSAKAWLHVQDFEVDAAFDLGLLKGNTIRKWVAAAERWLMRRFDVVSTISGRMHQRLLQKGVEPSAAKMAVNWVDLKQFAQASQQGADAYRQSLQIPSGSVVALYSGNMGGKQGLEVLAELAAIAQARADGRPEVVFVFCGNGAGRADLVQRCEGLPNVRFMDLQPVELLPDLLAMADIHLLPQRADAADLVMPSKLTGMLASARPVVATAHAGTELADVVVQCGLVVPPENAQALAEAVATLAADAALRKQLGANGLAYAQAHLGRDAVLQKFEADILALFPEESAQALKG